LKALYSAILFFAILCTAFIIFDYLVQYVDGSHQASPYLTIQEKCKEVTSYLSHEWEWGHVNGELDKVNKYDVEKYYTKGCEKGLLIEILEEEKKQTKLLEQQNCLLAYTSQKHTYGAHRYSFDMLEEACGKLLGVSKRL